MTTSISLALVVWCFLPESPVHLASKQDQQVCGNAGKEAEPNAKQRGAFWIWRLLFCGDSSMCSNHGTAPALWMSVLLTIGYQLTGIVLIMTDTRHLLSIAELDDAGVTEFSVGAGAVHFIGVCFGVLLLPHFGRRPLFLGSLLGMVVVMLGLAAAYSITAGPPWMPFVRGAVLLLAIFSFQIGMAPCFWIITAEIFPAPDRADAMGLVYSLVFLAATLESTIVPLLQLPVHVASWASVSAGVGFGVWLCLRLTLPETRHLVAGLLSEKSDSCAGDDAAVAVSEEKAAEGTDVEKKALLVQ